MSHDAQSELHQELLTGDAFPGILLIGNMLESINPTTLQKSFFRPYIIRKINCYIWLKSIFNFNA